MAVGAKRRAGLATREAILEAARHLFLRQGYHATGMREIAHDSGISLSSLYNHFTSKEQIFRELLAERNLYGAISNALQRARGDSVAELLESGFAEIMADLSGHEDFLLLVFIDVLEFQASHAAVLAGEAIGHVLAFFQRVQELGRQTGELRDVSPILMARTYMGMIFSSFIIENVLRGIPIPLRTRNWQQGTIDILLHGVLQPDSKGAPP